jgi:hypothetical protein
MGAASGVLGRSAKGWLRSANGWPFRVLCGVSALIVSAACCACGSSTSSSTATSYGETFSVLRGPAVSTVPARIASKLKLRGADVAQAHLVRTTKYTAWVIPAPSSHSVCVVFRTQIVAGGTGSCIPDADAETGTIFTGKNFFTGRWWIAGIAPDNVSKVRVTLATGRSQSFVFANNTLVASVTGRMTSATYLSATGTRISAQR